MGRADDDQRAVRLPLAAPVVMASIPTQVRAAPAPVAAPARQRVASAVAEAIVTSKAVASASVSAGRRAAAKPQRVAMLDGDLLSDLTSRARDEAGRR